MTSLAPPPALSQPEPKAPVVELYGAPSPPKSFFFAGAGYAYGVGCGVGPFFGMGVALGPRPLFGAGAGIGVYCGCGFGAGAVIGNGSGYIPMGATTAFFYTPRLLWAERIVEERRRRQDARRTENGDDMWSSSGRFLQKMWTLGIRRFCISS